MIPLGPWDPDAAVPNSGKSRTADGCIPTATGWGPFPRLVTASGAEALSAEPLGVASVQKADGTWQVYAATSTTIQSMASDYSWDDVETGRNAVTDYVSFTRFGKYLINTDPDNGMKAYDIEAGGTNDAISGAPDAKFAFTCANHVVALDCDGNNRRMQISDLGRHDVWAGGLANGKTFEDGAAIVGGCDLKNGQALILQERAVRLASLGAGLQGIVKIADLRGGVSGKTLIGSDGRAYWWDTDGPWEFNGGALVPIGAEVISRWADENIGAANYEGMWATMDPSRHIVIWRVSATQLLGFHWLLRRWFTLPANTTALTQLATPGVSIDSLSGTIDDLEFAINSRFLAGSAPVLGALDANRKFATFSGTSMAVTLESARVDNPVTGLVGWATPVTDSAGCSLELGVADRQDDDLVWKAAASRASSGRVPLRGRGKSLAFRMSIPAGETWTYATGLDHIQSSSGGPK